MVSTMYRLQIPLAIAIFFFLHSSSIQIRSNYFTFSRDFPFYIANPDTSARARTIPHAQQACASFRINNNSSQVSGIIYMAIRYAQSDGGAPHSKLGTPNCKYHVRCGVALNCLLRYQHPGAQNRGPRYMYHGAVKISRGRDKSRQLLVTAVHDVQLNTQSMNWQMTRFSCRFERWQIFRAQITDASFIARRAKIDFLIKGRQCARVTGVA